MRSVLPLVLALLGACSNPTFGSLPCAAQQECSACEACINDRCVEVEPSDDVFVDCEAPVDCSALPAATGGRLPITTGVQQPNIRFAGTGYALTWYDIPNGAYFARVAMDGALIGESVRSIDPDGLFARAVFNGSEYAVVHVRDVDITDQLPRELYLTRLDATGETIAGSQVRVGSTTYPEDPAVAWNGDSRQWGVMWEDHDEDGVFFARVDQAGQPISGSEQRLSDAGAVGQLGGGGAPLLVRDGEFVAVWSEMPPGRVKLARIGADGAVLAVSEHPANQPYRASLAWDGSGYGVAWMDPGDSHWQVHFSRAGIDGKFDPSTHLLLGEPGEEQSHPQVLWTGDGYSVFWSSYTNPTADVWVTDLSREGAPLARRRLTSDPIRQWFPNAVWDGCRHVVLYTADVGLSEGHLLFVPPAP